MNLLNYTNRILSKQDDDVKSFKTSARFRPESIRIYFSIIDKNGLHLILIDEKVRTILQLKFLVKRLDKKLYDFSESGKCFFSVIFKYSKKYSTWIISENEIIELSIRISSHE